MSGGAGRCLSIPTGTDLAERGRTSSALREAVIAGAGIARPAAAIAHYAATALEPPLRALPVGRVVLIGDVGRTR